MRRSTLIIFLVSVLFASVQAAGPFDGKWVGEAPSIEGCGVWKFYFTVVNGSVSGYVEGILQGQLARGDVLSGAVNTDGTAQIVWGKNNHFQGGFRFAGDALAGRFVGACGEASMTGRRAQS